MADKLWSYHYYFYKSSNNSKNIILKYDSGKQLVHFYDEFHLYKKKFQEDLLWCHTYVKGWFEEAQWPPLNVFFPTSMFFHTYARKVVVIVHWIFTCLINLPHKLYKVCAWRCLAHHGYSYVAYICSRTSRLKTKICYFQKWRSMTAIKVVPTTCRHHMTWCDNTWRKHFLVYRKCMRNSVS